MRVTAYSLLIQNFGLYNDFGFKFFPQHSTQRFFQSEANYV